jgi:predicted Zn-dependent protease with MMP-like domain
MFPAHPRASHIAAGAYRLLRFLAEAETYFRTSLRGQSDYGPSWSGLGATLFDQLRFEEAAQCQNRAIRCGQTNPEAYHQRGLLRERRGDFAGAARDFRRAYRLDPNLYPQPVPLDEDTISAVLNEAMHTLHPTIASYLKQIAIQVQDIPDPLICMQYDPPAPPGEILGYFSGISLPEQKTNDKKPLPGTLVLFRRNIERIAWDKERVLDEIRATVFAELGDYLGLTDLDLRIPAAE